MAEIAKSTGPAAVRGTTSRLSLATKLYSIFALFAVLVAAITALSDYNTRQNAALTEAVATASQAALNVERVNSLVYAVVMESRGVYMSTEPAVVKRYGEGLLKFNDTILGVVKNWQALVQADDAEQFEGLAAATQRIDGVLNPIQAIAEQTNGISSRDRQRGARDQ
jgi:methyl-accepting chemotaxis protein